MVIRKGLQICIHEGSKVPRILRRWLGLSKSPFVMVFFIIAPINTVTFPTPPISCGHHDIAMLRLMLIDSATCRSHLRTSNFGSLHSTSEFRVRVQFFALETRVPCLHLRRGKRNSSLLLSVLSSGGLFEYPLPSLNSFD